MSDSETRYALLLGNKYSLAGNPDQDLPQDAVAQSIKLMRTGLSNLGEYSFKWPVSEERVTNDILSRTNLTWGNFLGLFGHYAGNFNEDVLFLLYYFGHGFVHDNKLVLAFGQSTKGQAEKKSLIEVINTLYGCRIRKLILVVDTCHAQYAQNAFEFVARKDLNYVVLAASNRGLAFLAANNQGGLWTRALVEALEARNRGKLAVSPKYEVGTVARWYQTACDIMHNGQQPVILEGGLQDQVLLAFEKTVIVEVRGQRTDRTIYNRFYLLLRMLLKGKKSPQDLHNKTLVEGLTVFRLAEKKDPDEVDVYLSTDAIEGYLSYAKEYDLAEKDEQKYELTKIGEQALSGNGNHYNELLVKQIDLYLDRNNVDRALITEAMIEILESFDIPDAEALIRYANAKYEESKIVEIGAKDVNFALQMLSFCGELRNNVSDVFFPLLGSLQVAGLPESENHSE